RSSGGAHEKGWLLHRWQVKPCPSRPLSTAPEQRVVPRADVTRQTGNGSHVGRHLNAADGVARRTRTMWKTVSDTAGRATFASACRGVTIGVPRRWAT